MVASLAAAQVRLRKTGIHSVRAGRTETEEDLRGIETGADQAETAD